MSRPLVRVPAAPMQAPSGAPSPARPGRSRAALTAVAGPSIVLFAVTPAGSGLVTFPSSVRKDHGRCVTARVRNYRCDEQVAGRCRGRSDRQPGAVHVLASAAAIPRAAHLFLTPAVAVEPQPEPTPWDHDYSLRRFPDQEQA